MQAGGDAIGALWAISRQVAPDAPLALRWRVFASRAGDEGDACHALRRHQGEHASHEPAHREADQHEAVGCFGEDAARHAFERVVLVDVAVVNAAELAEIGGHVGPQIGVAHEPGQQHEMAVAHSYRHWRSLMKRAVARPSAMPPTTKPAWTAACSPPSALPWLNSTTD